MYVCSYAAEVDVMRLCRIVDVTVYVYPFEHHAVLGAVCNDGHGYLCTSAAVLHCKCHIELCTIIYTFLAPKGTYVLYIASCHLQLDHVI